MRLWTPGHGGPSPGIDWAYRSIVDGPDRTAPTDGRTRAGAQSASASAARDEIASARRTCKRAKLLGLFAAGYLLLLGAATLVA